MASSTEVAHQQHVAKLRSLSSSIDLTGRLSAAYRDSISTDDDDEDPDAIAYLERLKALNDGSEPSMEVDPVNKERESQSAQRATKALQRVSTASADLNWVAGQGNQLFVRSISSVKSDGGNTNSS